MSEITRAEYRSRASKASQKDNANISGSYVKILTLQLFLCVLILLSVVVVKQFGAGAYDILKQSYNEIIRESFTGKVLSENLDSIGNAVSKTFSFLNGTQQEETGIGGEMPVSSFINVKHLKAPQGTTLSPIMVFTGVTFPVEGGTVLSKFGYRTHPITGKPDFHTGIDICAPRGTRIMAAIGGTVKEITFSKIYGNVIVLNHGGGFETRYCHCDKILAPKGAKIKRGEAIALVGSTGETTGPHLHFEMRKDNVAADPMWVFDKGDCL